MRSTIKRSRSAASAFSFLLVKFAAARQNLNDFAISEGQGAGAHIPPGKPNGPLKSIRMLLWLLSKDILAIMISRFMRFLSRI